MTYGNSGGDEYGIISNCSNSPSSDLKMYNVIDKERKNNEVFAKEKYLNAKPIVAGLCALAILELRPQSDNVFASSMTSSL